MTKLNIFKLVALCCFCFFFSASHAQGIIPQPQKVTLTQGYMELDAPLAWHPKTARRNRKQFDYILTELQKHTNSTGKAKLLRLNNTAIASQKLSFHEEQGYKLEITPNEITISSPSDVGLFYGLQTLQQLCFSKKIACQVIEDAPKYDYRGWMLDCSRHFFSKEFIYKQIDAMALLKLNKLHLHLVDGGGWRIEMKQFPGLTRKGAYRTHSDWDEWIDAGRRFCEPDYPGAYGGYYTKKDLKDIINYAAKRFIMVIPEIEMPGHSNEVMAVYPELSCTGKGDGFDLCMGNPDTEVFLKKVLTEVMELFPAPYIHIGGDEATMRFWKNCPKCKQMMQKHNYTDTLQLQGRLILAIDSFVTKHGKSIIGWDEIQESGKLSNNAVVMSWRGEQGGLHAAKAQHRVIITPSKRYYLDAYQDNPSSQPRAIGGFTLLRNAYEYEPMPKDIENTDASKYIWGIQGNLWTEYIDTERYAEYMTYPRLLAIAESAWGTKTSYDAFKLRVIPFVNQLRKKGYNAFDITKEIGKKIETNKK